MKWCELREYKWNEYVTIVVNRNLSNCEKARKKGFRGFNGIRTHGLCVSAAVLSQLSYEDPYTGGWPIYWVHQPLKGMKHRMKWCELREYKWNEYVTIAVNRNLSNCGKARKKGFRGFNGIRTHGLCVSAAVLSQLSYEDPYTGGWPIYWVHQPLKGTHSVFHSFQGLMNSINWPASSIWVFIAQLGEHCSANAEAMGSNPVEAPKSLFSGFFAIA